MSAPNGPEILTDQPDPAGAETLAIMQAAPRYHAWQYRRVAPFLGRRIAEIGAGVGNMSQHLLSGRPDLLLLTDTDAGYRAALHERFDSDDSVDVRSLTLPDDQAAEQLREYRLDTVVAFNVIEHIPEDVPALRSIARMLMPGGRVVILVPALPSLYGSLDVELGHARRYTRRTLADAIGRAGLSVERVFYFNLLGSLGWWFSACVRRQPRIPVRQLRIFDALVPLLRLEDMVPLPLGQSVIGVGALRGH
jgi:SAM-dependent methyltransferase